MTDKINELFWFIRPGDDIAVFSSNKQLINSMKISKNTAKVYENVFPDKKVDLVLFDKGIQLSNEDCVSLLKNNLLPDGKVIFHKCHADLKKKLKTEDFLQEAIFGDYEVFIADFIKNYDKNFYHKEFEEYFKNLDTNLCSFSRDYHNPYMYRNIVQIGSRLKNEELLEKLCIRIIKSYPDNSPDKGGALCVLGYKNYVSKIKDSRLLTEIEQYCRNNTHSKNPHIQRWIISLNYLLAIYYKDILKDIEKALEYFKKSYNVDFRKFNGLICTKQVAACGHIGYIYLSDYDKPEMSKLWFKNGIERAKEALTHAPDKIVGAENCYIPFGFTETAELCDIASQCVFGYNNTDLFYKNKTVFDSLFHRKRFGLITKCQKLEKELEDLYRSH